MPDLALAARPRTTLGKKVKQLRNAGITPANIYGHNVPSVAIEADTHDLMMLLRRAGRTHLIQVTVEGERAPRPVLVRSYSRRPTTDQLLHVDFFQVSLREKLQVEVPLVLVGSAPVSETEDIVLMQQLQTVTVESLPTEIPTSIEVDLSPIVDTSVSIYVRDLRVSGDVSIVTDGDIPVVSVSAKTAEAEVAAEEAAEAAEEAAEAAEESAVEATEESASED